MRKSVLLCTVVIVCLIAACVIKKDFFGSVPEYKIHQSIKTGADNYTDVILRVIVNIRNYDIDQMYETVRRDYIALNGEPDILRIALFDSMKDFKRELPIGTKIYEKIIE